MIISTRGRYGLRAIFALAEGDGAPVSVKSIAEATQLSDTYLEQIFYKLRLAGLIASVRGAAGGYTLARPAEQIRVGDVLRALEGELAPSDCVTHDCVNAADCVTHDVWQKIFSGINNLVDSITLRDMLSQLSTKCCPQRIK